MHRIASIVACFLIAATIMGSQCAEVCSLLTCERTAQTKPPCHQSSGGPAPAGQCDHPEFVAVNARGVDWQASPEIRPMAAISPAAASIASVQAGYTPVTVRALGLRSFLPPLFVLRI